MLCLWLPFTDGTTKNYGLTNIDVVDYGTSVYDQGKLGKCRSFVGNGYLQLSNAFGIESGKDFSCCYWIKEISNNILSQFRVVYQCGNLIIGHYGNKFNIYSATGNALDLVYDCDTTEWVHCCMTYQGSNNTVTIYINGVKCSISQPRNLTGLSNTTALIGKRSSGTYLFEGYLNDLRIYNTCLSPRQVKEISKGLICHYPLGEIDGKIGGRNILRNSKNLASLSLKDTLAKVERTDTNCKLSLASGVISSSWYAIYTDFTIEKNQSYTASIEIETVNLASESKGCHFTAAKIPPNSLWNDFAEVDFKTPGKYHYTFNSGDNTSVRIALGVQGDGSSNYVIAKNLKLEKGTSVTSWTPAPEDDASFYDNVIYDTSGYCNNGSVTDSTCPTWSSDTPRYKGSYVFNGNNQYFTFHNPITSSSTDFTISYWVKFDDTTDTSAICTMRTAVGNGIALFKVGNKIRFDDNAQFTFSDYTISANAWTHVVVTRSSSCKKLYVNGILKQTVNTVGDMKLISNVGTIGASSQGGDGIFNYLNGQLSDFRIYATALSDSDILELYQSSASVDNNGNLSTYEIEEEL